MTDFTKILDKAKELESKMKESQEKIKNIQAEGTSGSNSVKVILNGENEMVKINLSILCIFTIQLTILFILRIIYILNFNE